MARFRPILMVCSALLISPACLRGQQGTALRTGERTTNLTKQCLYDYLGSTYTRTIPSYSLCPLSIQVQPSPPVIQPVPDLSPHPSPWSALADGLNQMGAILQAQRDSAVAESVRAEARARFQESKRAQATRAVPDPIVEKPLLEAPPPVAPTTFDHPVTALAFGRIPGWLVLKSASPQHRWSPDLRPAYRDGDRVWVSRCDSVSASPAMQVPARVRCEIGRNEGEQLGFIADADQLVAPGARSQERQPPAPSSHVGDTTAEHRAARDVLALVRYRRREARLLARGWSASTVDSIMGGQVGIGMSEAMAIEAWGAPTRRIETTSAKGTVLTLRFGPCSYAELRRGRVVVIQECR